MKTMLLAAFVVGLSLHCAPVAFAEDEIAPSSCSGTLSGAVQGHFSCVMIAVYGFAPGVGAVSFTPAVMPANVHLVTAAFQLPSEPRSGTVSFEDCVDCTASVSTTNGTVFLAQKKSPAQGTTSLTLTSAAATFPTPEGTIYAVHGSIDSEMLHESQVVKMHVEF